MDGTFEALAVFAYLIPGFLSSAFLDLLIDREKRETGDRVIEALVFSFLIYAALAIFTDATPVMIQRGSTENAIPTTVFNGDLIPYVLLVAALLPILISVCQVCDIPSKYLRKWGMTRLIAQPSLWMHAFSSERNCWVTVLMKNGDRFYGWPRFYSTSGDKRSLLLQHPFLVLPDNTCQRLESSSLLLLDEEIYYIEFTPHKPEGESSSESKTSSI